MYLVYCNCSNAGPEDQAKTVGNGFNEKDRHIDIPEQMKKCI